MKEIYSDINIIGGGLVGAATALSLSNLNYKITILEKNPIYNSKRKNLDHRTIAISEGTKKFFEKINIWNDINLFSEPIKKIRVIDRKIVNKLDFDNSRRESNLGYIVKNKELLNILYKKIRNSKNIKLFENVKISSIQQSNNSVSTFFNKSTLVSNLNIAADGKNSLVRKMLKTPLFSKNYNKKAFVITFTHSNDHKNTAFEFFFKNGPLAILPMQKIKENYASSIIWTNENNFLNDLINMSEEKIISILNKEINFCIGDIKKIVSKQLFNLSAHLNSKFYEKRLIYIGDSAHSFHPIAGQGWNLGMKDLETLTKISEKYKSLGLELGDNLFCKEYHDKTFYKAYRLFQITDKLDNIFKIQNSILSFTRSSGLNFIQNNKKIKNIISDFAMGIN